MSEASPPAHSQTPHTAPQPEPDTGSSTGSPTGSAAHGDADPDPDGPPSSVVGVEAERRPGEGGTPARDWRAPRRLWSLAIGLVAAGLLAVLLFGVIGTGPGSQSGQVVPVGSVAPGFTLPALGGGPPVSLYGLGRDRHRPVVLNFFASWCVPCRQETPMLAATARSARRSNPRVQFIGVDVSDVPSSAEAFVQQAGVDYPVAVDSDLTVTSGRYGLNGEPQTFFVDDGGRVVAHKLGALSRSELEQDLRQLSSG